MYLLLYPYAHIIVKMNGVHNSECLQMISEYDLSSDNAFIKHENKWYRFFDEYMSPLTEDSIVVSVL